MKTLLALTPMAVIFATVFQDTTVMESRVVPVKIFMFLLIIIQTIQTQVVGSEKVLHLYYNSDCDKLHEDRFFTTSLDTGLGFMPG